MTAPTLLASPFHLDPTDPAALLRWMEQDGNRYLDGLPAGDPTAELLDARLHDVGGLSGSVRASVTAEMLASGRLMRMPGGPRDRERYAAVAVSADVPAYEVSPETTREPDFAGVELVTITEAAERWGCERHCVVDAVKKGYLDMGPNRPGLGPDGMRQVALTPATLAYAARWTGEHVADVPTDDRPATRRGTPGVEPVVDAQTGDGLDGFALPVLDDTEPAAEHTHPGHAETPVLVQGDTLTEPTAADARAAAEALAHVRCAIDLLARTRRTIRTLEAVAGDVLDDAPELRDLLGFADGDVYAAADSLDAATIALR